MPKKELICASKPGATLLAEKLVYNNGNYQGEHFKNGFKEYEPGTKCILT